MTVRGPFALILVVLLVVSLAANFLILGFAAARYHDGDEHDSIERIVTLGSRAFPRDLRHQIRRELGRHHPELREAVRDLDEAREDMFQQMANEPLDREALDEAFERVRRETDRLQRLGQSLVEDILEDASPESRAKIRPRRRRH